MARWDYYWPHVFTCALRQHFLMQVKSRSIHQQNWLHTRIPRAQPLRKAAQYIRSQISIVPPRPLAHYCKLMWQRGFYRCNLPCRQNALTSNKNLWHQPKGINAITHKGYVCNGLPSGAQRNSLNRLFIKNLALSPALKYLHRGFVKIYFDQHASFSNSRFQIIPPLPTSECLQQERQYSSQAARTGRPTRNTLNQAQVDARVIKSHTLYSHGFDDAASAYMVQLMSNQKLVTEMLTQRCHQIRDSKMSNL